MAHYRVGRFRAVPGFYTVTGYPGTAGGGLAAHWQPHQPDSDQRSGSRVVIGAYHSIFLF
eukprot:3661125-Rhodomonas_salina.1